MSTAQRHERPGGHRGDSHSQVLSLTADLTMWTRARQHRLIDRPGAGECSICQRDACDDLDHLATARPIFAAALKYAAAGWATFPLRAASKLPATTNGLRDATRDPERLEGWFPPGTRYNLGAVVPPGLVALDLDGPDAVRALRALDLATPATARQKTPRGWHLIYRLPAGAEARQTAGEIAPGVDTRAAGKGYLVVSPSIVNGTAYRWEVEPMPSNIAEAPAWLLDKLTATRTEAEPPPCRDWRPVAGAVVGNGARNATLASVAGLLFRRLPAELAYDLASLWARHRCTPPLPEQETARTLDSIARLELQRREVAT